MKSYEGMFVIRPDISEDDTKKVIEDLSRQITESGGSIEESAAMGKQQLAYRVGSHHEGFYQRLDFKATPETVGILSRRLKLNQNVIRYLFLTK